MIAPNPRHVGGFLYQTFGGDDVRRITRDSIGRPTLIVQAPDSAATVDSLAYEYDGLGRVWRMTRSTAAHPVPAGSTRDVTVFEYDSLTVATNGAWCSRLLTTTDPMGGVSRVVYGQSGYGQCLPVHAIGLANDTTSFSYGTLAPGQVAGVRPVKVRDPNGLVDSVAYDPVSWNSQASVRQADGATARMFYDLLGRPDSILDPVGRRTRFLRDRLGRVTHQQVGTGALAPVSRTVYGLGGLVQQTDVYQADGADIAIVAPGTPVQSTINHYDRAGLPDSIIHPGSRTVSGTTGHQARKQWYARRDNWGNPQYETRGNGSVIGRLYDWQGRVTFANHSQVSPVFSWDGERFADEKSLAWYNSLALRTGPQYSVGQIHEYKYDNKGQVVWTNSRDSYAGQLSERRSGYSRRGLLISDTLTFAGKATVIRSFEYNRRGQRTKVTDQVLVSGGHQLLDGSGNGETRYVYHSLTARLDSMVASASSGEIARVQFAYDKGGRETLRTVKLGGMTGEVRTTTAYDAVGRLAGRQTVNAGGLPSRTWYDFSTPQYSTIDELLGYTAVEPGFLSRPYAFDYSTDGTRRLTHSTADNTTNSWSYDRFGNRASENTSGTGSNCPGYGEFAYAEDNRLLRRSEMPGCDNSVRYWSDQAGNRLGEADTTHTNPPGVPPIEGLRSIQTYTAANQLYFSATPTAIAGNYDFNWNWYDANGVRIAAQASSRSGSSGDAFYPMPHPDSLGGSRYYYVYDGSDINLVLTRVGSGWRVEQRLLVGGVDQVIAGRFGSGASAKHLALVSDRQGTTLAAAKVDGTQECSADQYSRDPFGSLQSQRAQGCGGNATQTGYTGASTPNASGGFTYLRNRWYDPQTGRFLTQDPIGLAGGANLYAYAGNNPITFTDPFGLCPESRRDSGGKCPGGLSVGEWNNVKGSLKHMTFEAQKRTSRLLGSGNIRGYNAEDPRRAGRVHSDTPETVEVNRSSVIGNIFDHPVELPKTLIHEGQHVEQLKGKAPGAEAQQYMSDNYEALEQDAAEYEKNNYVP